ncbi:hypothetical protein WICMUC_001494 [Wickerhamomyces mucosus]|uniref:Uncharacterized protein n=1 Tax=Wickerhamomyces mucosus TaxID=1378264 RepID=A0A9P8PVQ2_9ASCO|nr:hypothetical protein WICMUC_001494 [Wickerhamomyces mucosus]
MNVQYESPTKNLLRTEPVYNNSNNGPIIFPSPRNRGITSRVQKSPKRKISDDYTDFKKLKPNNINKNGYLESKSKKMDYPTFVLSDGSTVQQTPFGNLRTIIQGNTEVSVIDKNVDLNTFVQTATPLIPLTSSESTSLPKSTNLKSNSNSTTSSTNTSNYPSLCPSPTNEVESYMIEGYNNSYKINQSYTNHKEEILNINYCLYDNENEDSHLDNDDYDMNL